jgi:FkbM family methyltransferase
VKQVKGWWLPDTDTDFDRWILDGDYQKEHRDGILNFLKTQGVEFNNCLDVGAHVGFWLKDLQKTFKMVYAFEPISDVRECLKKNVEKDNYLLFDFGLGDKNEKVMVNYIPEETGNTYVSDHGNREIQIRRLDEIKLPKIDYIKIDAEGYEIKVLQGAEGLITRDEPYIHVEVKQKILERHGLSAVDIDRYFEEIDYKKVYRIKSEFVYAKK